MDRGPPGPPAHRHHAQDAPRPARRPGPRHRRLPGDPRRREPTAPAPEPRPARPAAGSSPTSAASAATPCPTGRTARPTRSGSRSGSSGPSGSPGPWSPSSGSPTGITPGSRCRTSTSRPRRPRNSPPSSPRPRPGTSPAPASPPATPPGARPCSPPPAARAATPSPGAEGAQGHRRSPRSGAESWATGCLAPAGDARPQGPRLRPGRRPGPGHAGDRRRSGLDSLGRDPAPEFAERQVQALNCLACHRRDGFDDALDRPEGRDRPAPGRRPGRGEGPRRPPLPRRAGPALADLDRREAQARVGRRLHRRQGPLQAPALPPGPDARLPHPGRGARRRPLAGARLSRPSSPRRPRLRPGLDPRGQAARQEHRAELRELPQHRQGRPPSGSSRPPGSTS